MSNEIALPKSERLRRDDAPAGPESSVWAARRQADGAVIARRPTPSSGTLPSFRSSRSTYFSITGAT
jgi:hypothetical protein